MPHFMQRSNSHSTLYLYLFVPICDKQKHQAARVQILLVTEIIQKGLQSYLKNFQLVPSIFVFAIRKKRDADKAIMKLISKNPIIPFGT